MNLVRKGFVHVLAIVLFLALLGAALTYGINTTFGTPQKVEKLLSDSKVYDHFVSSALEGAQQDNQKDGGDSSVPLDDPAVKQAAEKAFSTQLIEQSVNQFLEANYAWLQGKADKPGFNINLTNPKQDFATQVGNYVTQRLKALPACTPQQMKQLQIPVDVFKTTCLPSNLDPVSEGKRVQNDIASNDNFLGQPVLTAETVGQESDANTKPYYLEFSKLPEVYRWTQRAPLILAGLAVLVSAGIIFIHPSRRKGWRRTGLVFAEAGVILIVTKLIGDSLVSKVKAATADNSAARHFQDQWGDLLNKIEASLTRNNFWFGLFFVLVAVTIFIYLYKARQGSVKPKPAVQNAPQNQPQEPGPAPAPLNGAAPPAEGSIEDRLRQPKPAGPPPVGSQPLGPNPPRRKPPRLIQ